MIEQMKEIILQYVEVEESAIVPESRFIEDLGFNSYDFMSILGEFEEKFGVTVNETDIINIQTVGEAAEYINSLK
ncbi:MAG: acyl carrier protein [Oscillospiraceae bacterium]|nr:acyl carrier protein [Oscillospiraceae bacterium]